MSPVGIGLLVAATLFVLFVMLKSRYSFVGKDPARKQAREQFVAAKARARAAGADSALRSTALREAALIALDGLHQPNLAASYARRAARAAPDDAASLRVAALAMRRAHRYAALERLLWRRLDQELGSESAIEELLALYEGPLKRPEQARVLRALWACRSETLSAAG